MKPAPLVKNPEFDATSPTETVSPPAEETLAVRDLLAGLEPGDLAICVSFLQQSVGEIAPKGTPCQALTGLERRVCMPEAARRRFVNIIARLVRGQEGISRLEIAFLRQIWHGFRGDWEPTVGAPLSRSAF